MRRILIAGAIAAVLIFVSTANPAQAGNGGPQGTGTANPTGATAGASSGGPVPVAPGGPTDGGGSGCAQGYTYESWVNLGGGVFVIGNGASIVVTAGQAAPALGGEFVPSGTTSITDVICGGNYVTTVFGGPAGPVLPVSPAQLAQQAVASAPFQPIRVQMSPPPTREAVNFPIFLSVPSGFSPVTATASAGGVISTVTIIPTRVTWAMGDGHSVSCAGPGVAFDPSRSFTSQLLSTGLPPCGYRYQRSSANQAGEAFQVTVTLHYSATWTVIGAPGGGSLPGVDRSVTVSVTVGEIQILNS